MTKYQLLSKITSQIPDKLLTNNVLMLSSQDTGCAGGDLNCIVDKRDATNNPEAKMSKALLRLIKLKEWNDSYHAL